MIVTFNSLYKRRGGLMVSALVSESSGPCSSPGQGHYVVFLGKTLDSPAVPLSTQVYKWVLANLKLGVFLRWTSIPSRGLEVLLVTSYYRNRDKRRPDGPLGSYAVLPYKIDQSGGHSSHSSPDSYLYRPFGC